MQRKVKGLMPSLKERKRYISIKLELPEENSLVVRQPLQEIAGKLNEYLGVLGAAEAGIMPISYDYKQGIAIMRVSNNKLDEVRSGLLFIGELGTQSVILKSLKVSGMINRVKKDLS